MSADESVSNELVYRLIGLSSLVVFPVTFGIVGLTALESLPYGVIAGVLSGIGSYLFVPWFVGLAGETDSETDGGQASLGELLDASEESPGPKLFGLGMDLGGIVMFAVGFVTDTPNLLVGTASGLLVAVGIYFVGSVAVDRITADAV